ncbi:hypothetical protein LguiA_010560 [Lonicera macranthoides]
MDSSPEEDDHSVPIKALGSNMQLDIDEVSNACFINGDCSEISLLNTEVEKLLSDEQSEELHFCLDNAEYFEKIEQFHVYIDEVKNIVRPGCSQELLNVALSYVSSLAGILSLEVTYHCFYWDDEAVRTFGGVDLFARVGRLMFAIAVYAIWRERNHRIFAGNNKREELIVKEIKSYAVAKAHDCFACFELCVWLVILGECPS